MAESLDVELRVVDVAADLVEGEFAGGAPGGEGGGGDVEETGELDVGDPTEMAATEERSDLGELVGVADRGRRIGRWFVFLSHNI